MHYDILLMLHLPRKGFFMASMLDSFRETYSDKFSFFKILLFAVPIYFFYDHYLKGPAAFAAVTFYLYVIGFFMFGFFIKTINFVLNEKETVMPPLNPLKLGLAATKGIVAILPSSLICVFLANYINQFINIIPWLDITLKSTVWLVASSIILTSFLMFAKGEKVLDAFDIKALSEKAGDFILGIIFYVLQLALINIPTTGLIGYSIYILFGFGPLLYAFLSYAIVFNIVATAHYMAQLQYEILGYDRQDYVLIK